MERMKSNATAAGLENWLREKMVQVYEHRKQKDARDFNPSVLIE
jgi:hypothetical protein